MNLSSSVCTAYLGLGSNLDNPIEQVTCGLNALAQLPHSHLVTHSRLFRSVPLGYQDQPDFINAVARLDTELDPESLLDHLLDLEHRQGRQRLFANGPRTLDLDILLYGTLSHHSQRLHLPHPRLSQRAFVLLPWLDIAPGGLMIGQLGTLAELASQCLPPHATPLTDR